MTAKMGRTAWGLDPPHTEDWWTRGLCRTMDPELWHASYQSKSTIATARHLCTAHCPALERCRTDTPPIRSAVVAGVFYNQTAEPSDWQPHTDRCALCAPRRPTPADGPPTLVRGRDGLLRVSA